MAANNTDVIIDLLEQFIAVRQSSSTPEQSKDYFLKRGYSSLEIDTALRRVYSGDKLNTQIPHSVPPLRGDDTPRSDTVSPSIGLFHNIPADNQSSSTSSLPRSALSPLVSRDSIDLNIPIDPQSGELPIIKNLQDPKPGDIKTSSTKEPVKDIPLIVESKLLAEANKTLAQPVAQSVSNPPMRDLGKAPKEKLMPIEEHPTNIDAASSANLTPLLSQATNELNQSDLHLALKLKTSSNQLMEFSKIDDDPLECCPDCLEYCPDCLEEFTFNEKIEELVLGIQQHTVQDLNPAKLLQAHIVRILNFLEILEENPDYTSSEHSLNTTVIHSQNNPPILYMQHLSAKIQTGTNNHSTTSGSNPIDTSSNRKDTVQRMSPDSPPPNYKDLYP